jgi:G3E family GTPase
MHSFEMENIPTNIITGFLGVGKSTAIQHLLNNKPAEERWAVLVNEFGEVGIDGNLIAGGDGEAKNIFVREVPGGCMCCTAGLPMQMALTMLLARAKPDRLLIEPTGLGHPEEVLATLSGEHYKKVLDLRATITLVDARKVKDDRYTSNDTFNQQLGVADVIVANKADLYEEEDLQKLQEYLSSSDLLEGKPLFEVRQGCLEMEWLSKANNTQGRYHQHPVPEGLEAAGVDSEPALPDSGYLRIDNQASGFYSSGWRFDSRFVFDYDELYSHLLGVSADRLKAVFITDKGIFGFNQADAVLSVMALDEAPDSRLEVIGTDPAEWDGLEAVIKSCCPELGC